MARPAPRVVEPVFVPTKRDHCCFGVTGVDPTLRVVVHRVSRESTGDHFRLPRRIKFGFHFPNQDLVRSADFNDLIGENVCVKHPVGEHPLLRGKRHAMGTDQQFITVIIGNVDFVGGITFTKERTGLRFGTETSAEPDGRVCFHDDYLVELTNFQKRAFNFLGDSERLSLKSNPVRSIPSSLAVLRMAWLSMQ